MAQGIREAEQRLHYLLSSRNSRRFGHRRFFRPHWRFESQDVPLNWGRLENESDESWTKRSEGEQKKYMESCKKLYSRRDGESKKETLERLDQGFQTLRNQLAVPAYSINSEDQPLEWKSYEAFARTCYQEYTQLVESIFESAEFWQAPEKPYNPADHQAVLALGRLKSTAVHGEYYAKNINERLAKAWANGEHRPTFRKLKHDETYPLWEQRQNELKATGVTIEGGLNDFESCFYTIKDLPGKLDSSFKDGEAGSFSAGYRDSFHEFRNFVQRITTGLKGKNVLPYLGKPYRELFEAAIEAVETLDKKEIEVVCPKLSSSASSDMQGENATTIRILKRGLDAAKGS